MSFSDSDWTRDPPAHARVPLQQRRALTLAIAIAVSCLAIALAVYGIEQWLDAAARSESLSRMGDVAAVAPPSAGVAGIATTAAASAALPASAQVPNAALLQDTSGADAALRGTNATSAPPAASQPAAQTPVDVNAQQLVKLEAEMRQRARETAEQAAVDAARRKDRAWQRYYQRPDFCADNPTAAQMVQCANHHIRARKEFEERYAAGKL
jgi:hypothetical protein